MRGSLRDAAIVVGAFVLATVIAELVGAENLGTSLTFGVIAFMGTIVGLILLRRDERLEDAADEPAAPVAKRPPPPPRRRTRR